MVLPPSAVDGVTDGAVYIEATVTYNKGSGATKQMSAHGAARVETSDAAAGLIRSDAVNQMAKAIHDASGTYGKTVVDIVASIAALSKRVAVVETKTRDGRVAALRMDVDGRMSKALQGQARFNRWGKHYLRALMRAHQIHCCTNFMDAGLQVYGVHSFERSETKVTRSSFRCLHQLRLVSKNWFFGISSISPGISAVATVHYLLRRKWGWVL
jgi:hypothetical protein